MERIWIFMKITEDIIYAGVNDHQVDLFEGQYKVPNGMAYNSYVILDEKTAVMDTVDANFADEWLANVAKALDGRKPDYLIVQAGARRRLLHWESPSIHVVSIY